MKNVRHAAASWSATRLTSASASNMAHGIALSVFGRHQRKITGSSTVLKMIGRRPLTNSDQTHRSKDTILSVQETPGMTAPLPWLGTSRRSFREELRQRVELRERLKAKHGIEPKPELFASTEY